MECILMFIGYCFLFAVIAIVVGAVWNQILIAEDKNIGERAAAGDLRAQLSYRLNKRNRR
jgi:hypothetical protein